MRFVSIPSFRGSLFRRVAVLFAAGVFSAALLAQDNANGDNANGANGGGRGRRGQNGGNGGNGGGRGNFDPAQMQQQMMDRMREQLGVTDDAEWSVISERASKVMELERNNAAGGRGGMAAFGGFGGGRGGNGGGQGGRGFRGGAGNVEIDALRQAITDKLPDAEIKSRLERLREVRKKNQEDLTKAQEDLRAVLSVRQEALFVTAGLLP
jgi:hypothetical protein